MNQRFRLRGMEFEAHPAMPDRHHRRLRKARAGRFEVAAAAIRATLVPADRGRWDRLLADDSVDPPISFDVLWQIARDLVGKPTPNILLRETGGKVPLQGTGTFEPYS